MQLDKDLQSIQDVRTRTREAKKAQQILEDMTQEKLNAITRELSRAAAASARRLGQMAAEETGFGRAADKELKNRFAAVQLYEAIRDQKTHGILSQNAEKKTMDIGVPVGVVAGIIPSTNPSSTAIYKAMICMKAGNPVVFSPHPSALKTITETVRILSEAAREAGAPEGAISCLTLPTMQATKALMQDENVRLILATGGTAMVRAAYSSGTPAIGVGAGNGPAYIHHTAEVALAVRRILDSKTFDNGTICASEQSIIIERRMERAVLDALAQQGAYLLPETERARLGGFILRSDGRMNPAIVGKSVGALVALAGLHGVPENTRVLVAREDGVGEGHPFSSEKLGLVLALYVEESEAEVLRRSQEILAWEGAGHTFSIHAEDEAVVEKFALAVPASRVLVNTPAALGGIGATTCLFPALTLGCGAVGGSSSSNNIGPLDLINIKRVAWGVRELEQLRGAQAREGVGQIAGQMADLDEQKLEKMVREMVGRLRQNA